MKKRSDQLVNLKTEEEHKENIISALLNRPTTKPKMQYVEKPGILDQAREFLSFAKRHEISENQSASTKIDENLVFLGEQHLSDTSSQQSSSSSEQESQEEQQIRNSNKRNKWHQEKQGEQAPKEIEIELALGFLQPLQKGPLKEEQSNEKQLIEEVLDKEKQTKEEQKQSQTK